MRCLLRCSFTFDEFLRLLFEFFVRRLLCCTLALNVLFSLNFLLFRRLLNLYCCFHDLFLRLFLQRFRFLLNGRRSENLDFVRKHSISGHQLDSYAYDSGFKLNMDFCFPHLPQSWFPASWEGPCAEFLKPGSLGPQFAAYHDFHAQSASIHNLVNSPESSTSEVNPTFERGSHTFSDNVSVQFWDFDLRDRNLRVRYFEVFL